MTAKAGYHHGDLPDTLRREAAVVLAERGLAGFSLREVSRRAGVSHTAATHHYGDVGGLLTAVAVEAFQMLTTETEAAVAGVDDPVDALARVGRAYVRVGVRHPGHCAVMFRLDVIDVADPAFTEWSGRAYSVLYRTVERLAEQRADLDVPLVVSMCWAMVQGLLTLDEVLVGKGQEHGMSPMSLDELAARMSALLGAALLAQPA